MVVTTSADPMKFLASLIKENVRVQSLVTAGCRVPSIDIARWADVTDQTFPSICIFGMQQPNTSTNRFDGSAYLNIRQVRIEVRTDDVDELHMIEEEIQYVVGSNSINPTTTQYSSPNIEHIKINNSVDIYETITDVVVYRRSIIVDCYSQYSY